MAAADSLIGEGLAPSPYAEALINLVFREEQLEDAKNVIACQEATIKAHEEENERLRQMVRLANIERFHHKMGELRLTRKCGALEDDIKWLREVLTNVSRGCPTVHPEWVGGPR